MIGTFRNKALRHFYETGEGRRLSVQNEAWISRILRALDDARHPEDIRLPGLRLHMLTGDQKGCFAVDASGNWRITFGWDGEEAIDIDLEDYH